jgi:hypothetical protein
VECFFSKINTEECKDPWDITQEICEQIYSDKKFFIHSFEVKEQNGFWEEVQSILMPYFRRDFPSYGDADRMRDFFTSTDIYRVLTLIEEWIMDGMKISPQEFASALRTSYIVYATWISEVATGRKATEFPAEMLEPVGQIKNKQCRADLPGIIIDYSLIISLIFSFLSRA